MFQNKRYLTKAIEFSISLELQIFLWELIDKKIRSNEKLDY